MAIFLLKRLGWLVVTLWVVFTVSFFLMRAVPGGPFSNERKLPPEIKQNFEARYKLNDHLLTQYWDNLSSIAFELDFGPSMRKIDYQVSEVIAEGFPVSASLGIFALVFALSLGMTAGVVSAVRRSSIYDVGLMALATLGIAVPNFVLASVAVIFFVFMLQILPAAGWGSFQQLLLPALCLGVLARQLESGRLSPEGRSGPCARRGGHP